MPGWHAATKPWVDDGRLVVLGVVQEQHAQRTQLYKQWRQLQWPIVHDAFNILQIKVVPLAIAIDENGVVREHRANPRFIEKWLNETTSPIDVPSPSRHLDFSLASPNEPSTVNPEIPSMIQRLEKRVQESERGQRNPRSHFELGVAYRTHFDETGDPQYFQKAVDHWSQALKLDPNHYIYRRRIEQYGARLIKPYPFYDWVGRAQTEIVGRGETPIELSVALSGAEIAEPARKFVGQQAPATHPDPDAQIMRDDGLIEANVIVVPKTVKPGSAARVYVLFKPGAAAKWNNESQPTQVWVGETNAAVSEHLFELPLPEQAESAELRRCEFEVQMPENANDRLTIPAFALFNVCLSETGQCVYLRKDIEIVVDVAR